MMEIDEDEILRSIAAGGSLNDYSAWPALLTRIVARIEKIAHEEFTIPNLPPPPPPPQPLPVTTTVPSSIPQATASGLQENFLPPLPSSPTDPHTASSSPDTNKENNPIVPQSTPAAPPSTSAPVASNPLPPGTLPAQIEYMLTDVTSYLNSTFPTYPPHTIQRISELVVNPRQHYKSLVSYLHALDRVVRVTSGINIYPLPSTYTEVPGSLANGVLDTTARPSSWAAPGSDEALGGALLTPIPWIQHNHQSLTGSPVPAAQTAAPTQDAPAELEGEVRTESTETIDGPNGVGSIETVSVSVNGIPSMGARGVGVTQGELLRQEQRAGLVPVSQLVPSHHVQTGSNASAAAAHQQQLQTQARIQHQRALTQSQNQARVSSAEESPNSPASAPNTASTQSSATLDGEGTDAVTDDGSVTVAPVHSNNLEDDQKPHARGPGEIGADDIGPQNAITSALPTPTATGGMIQGIDIQAAVGRKPLDVSSPSRHEGDAKDDGDNDKMDVEEDRLGRLSTPKRDAEERDDGPASKRLKEDSTPTTGETVDPNPKSADTETESQEGKQEDAMDKD